MTRISLLLHSVLLLIGVLLVCPVALSHPPRPVQSQPVVFDNSTDLSGDKKPENDASVVMEYRSRRSFHTDEEYGQYVQKTLRIGQRVRALVDYESVTKGMMGTYYGTNGNTPPCLIVWDKNLNSGSAQLPSVPPGKATHVYWVFWHQIEILAIKP